MGLDLLWLASKCWTYRRDGRLSLAVVRQKLREMHAAVEEGMEEERKRVAEEKESGAEHNFLCPITRVRRMARPHLVGVDTRMSPTSSMEAGEERTSVCVCVCVCVS